MFSHLFHRRLQDFNQSLDQESERNDNWDKDIDQESEQHQDLYKDLDQDQAQALDIDLDIGTAVFRIRFIDDSKTKIFS